MVSGGHTDHLAAKGPAHGTDRQPEAGASRERYRLPREPGGRSPSYRHSRLDPQPPAPCLWRSALSTRGSHQGSRARGSSTRTEQSCSLRNPGTDSRTARSPSGQLCPRALGTAASGWDSVSAGTWSVGKGGSAAECLGTGTGNLREALPEPQLWSQQLERASASSPQKGGRRTDRP